jgi:subtilisin family serine protease
MQLVRATSAEAYSTGSGTIIADINSLVDRSHPALASHLIAGYDFVVEQGGGNASLNQAATFLDQSSASFLDQSSASFLDQSSASFLDQSSASFLDGLNPASSHGTLCAGVIAAVAPGSMIMPLRAFDENGTSSVFTLAKAIRYAVRQGAEVINMSFGTLAPSRTLEEAVNVAAVAGVTLVASAGNNNTSQPQYPAAYPNVMAVAATDLADIKAWFSNYGSHIFVTAPGVHVISAYPGNLYGVVSGTSFSAPFVAGTAGLIRSITDTAPGNRIGPAARNIDLRNPWYAGRLGHGRLDVYSAVN